MKVETKEQNKKRDHQQNIQSNGSIKTPDCALATVPSNNGDSPHETVGTEKVALGRRIMSPYQPDWGEFCSELGISWNSKDRILCSKDLSLAKEALKKFPYVDVDGTLEYFRDRGVSCECSLYSHVQPDLSRDINHMEFFEYLTRITNNEALFLRDQMDTRILTPTVLSYVLKLMGYEVNSIRLEIDVKYEFLEGTVAFEDINDRSQTPGEGFDNGHGYLGVLVMNRYLIHPVSTDMCLCLDDYEEDVPEDLDLYEVPPLITEVSHAFLAEGNPHELEDDNVCLRYRAIPMTKDFERSIGLKNSKWMPVAEKILNRLLFRFLGSNYGPGMVKGA